MHEGWKWVRTVFADIDERKGLEIKYSCENTVVIMKV